MSHGRLKITSFLILMLSGSVVSAVAGFFICAAVNNGGFKALGSLRLKEMANRYSPIATILGFFIFETIALVFYVIIHGDELAEDNSKTETKKDETDKKEKSSASDNKQVTVEMDKNGLFQVPLPDIDDQYDSSEISSDSLEIDTQATDIDHTETSDVGKEELHIESERLAEELSDGMTKDADEYEASIPNELDYLLGRISETEKVEEAAPVIEEKPSENDILSECTLSSDVVSRLRENDTYSPEQIMSISKITDYIPASSISYSFIRKMFNNSLSVDDILDKIVALYG